MIALDSRAFPNVPDLNYKLLSVHEGGSNLSIQDLLFLLHQGRVGTQNWL